MKHLVLTFILPHFSASLPARRKLLSLTQIIADEHSSRGWSGAKASLRDIFAKWCTHQCCAFECARSVVI